MGRYLVELLHYIFHVLFEFLIVGLLEAALNPLSTHGMPKNVPTNHKSLRGFCNPVMMIGES